MTGVLLFWDTMAAVTLWKNILYNKYHFVCLEVLNTKWMSPKLMKVPALWSAQPSHLSDLKCFTSPNESQIYLDNICHKTHNTDNKKHDGPEFRFLFHLVFISPSEHLKNRNWRCNSVNWGTSPLIYWNYKNTAHSNKAVLGVLLSCDCVHI